MLKIAFKVSVRKVFAKVEKKRAIAKLILIAMLDYSA
jgi:hypothetical protein